MVTTVNDQSAKPLIHELPPAEQAGRDTIARFEAQFRAAAYACLEMLNGRGIDRVYCDFHDDFVVRENREHGVTYHFYQVKTKAKTNSQWSRNEVFGLRKKAKTPNAEKLAKSFAGKLLLHTVRFSASCGKVVFLTNIHLDDELSDVAKDLETGATDHELLKLIIKSFPSVYGDAAGYSEEAVRDRVKRLVLKSGVPWLDPGATTFGGVARDAIFRYSEIDLQHRESEEIAQDLVDLVRRKSCADLTDNLHAGAIDATVGVGITDMLEILSISPSAYDHLISGGDPKALRSASILHRYLERANFSQDLIEFACKQKVEWDAWLRDTRHVVPEYELNRLLERLETAHVRLRTRHVTLEQLGDKEVDPIWDAVKSHAWAGTLTKGLLLGGVFAALVRSET